MKNSGVYVAAVAYEGALTLLHVGCVQLLQHNVVSRSIGRNNGSSELYAFDISNCIPFDPIKYMHFVMFWGCLSQPDRQCIVVTEDPTRDCATHCIPARGAKLKPLRLHARTRDFEVTFL
jgi:hypothetical protein